MASSILLGALLTFIIFRYLQRKRGPSTTQPSVAPASPPVAKAPAVKQKLAPLSSPTTLPKIHHRYEDDAKDEEDEDSDEDEVASGLFGQGVLGKVIEKDVSIYNVQVSKGRRKKRKRKKERGASSIFLPDI